MRVQQPLPPACLDQQRQDDRDRAAGMLPFQRLDRAQQGRQDAAIRRGLDQQARHRQPSLARGLLKTAGCKVVRAEKASGSLRDGRSELQVLLDFVQPGDTLIVTRIDRLARSMKDLQDIVHELKAKGVALRATEQPVDTGTAAGKAFLDMLGVFAEFETNLRRERQLEGIKAAKALGIYKGRKPTIDPVELRRLRDEEKLGPAAIARRLGIGRASVYRLLGTRKQTA